MQIFGSFFNLIQLTFPNNNSPIIYYIDNFYMFIEHLVILLSADKRWFGWKVGQIRNDRIGTALICTGVWHNLMNLYTD